MAAKTAKKTAHGRHGKNKFEQWRSDQKLTLLTNWARKGLTDADIAKNIGISRSTLSEWKRSYPDISDALNTGAREADAIVENALYLKTQGHTITLKRPFKVKEKIFDKATGKLLEEKEHIEMADYEEYVPADTTAQIFWLKNRLPEVWRDKINAELGGKVEHIDKLPEEDAELLRKVVSRLESYRSEGAEE